MNADELATRIEACRRDGMPLEVTAAEYRELMALTDGPRITRPDPMKAGFIGQPFGIPVMIVHPVRELVDAAWYAIQTARRDRQPEPERFVVTNEERFALLREYAPGMPGSPLTIDALTPNTERLFGKPLVVGTRWDIVRRDAAS